VTLQLRSIGLLTLLVCIYSWGCGDSPHEPGFFGEDPIPRADKDPLTGGSDGITVPTTGTSNDGGTFRGTITISGALFSAQIGPALLVRIRGTLIPASTDDGEPSENGTLNFEPMEMSYDDRVRADEDCIELELSPGSVTDSEAKQTIALETSRVTTRTLPGPANIIADLICANDRAADVGWSWQKPPQ
jgi:hypothetical protein